MKEEYRKIANELLGLPEDAEINFKGCTDTAVTNLMICKRLDRIADVLEDINSTLIGVSGSVEELEKCVAVQPARRRGYVNAEGFHFLRIGGSVDTGA